LNRFVLSLALVGLIAPSIAVAQTKPAKLPTVPEVLKPLKGTVRNHFNYQPGVTLAFTAVDPPTAEQWEAIESFPVRHMAASGRGIDDVALARLSKLPLEALQLEHAVATDAGAAVLREMTGLKQLILVHSRLTEKSAAALAKHPALEVFSDDGRLGAYGMREIATAPRLRRVRLAHGAANNASVAALADHPAIEMLYLWPSNTYGLTDKAIPALATLPELADLTITDSVLHYADSLERLQRLPKLKKLTLREVAISEDDLARLKADLPQVAIEHLPMSDVVRKRWDFAAAKRKQP
jgi:hypothetical protein